MNLFTRLAWIFTLGAAQASAAPISPTAFHCPNPVGCTVKFEFLDNRIFVAAQIGTPARELHFIFDTGGQNSLTIAAAKQLGLRLTPAGSANGAGGGKIPMWTTRVPTYSLGDRRGSPLTAHDQEFLVMDLSPIARAFRFKHFDGIIGYELLQNFLTRIDYDRHELTFSSAATRPGETSIAIEMVNHHPVVTGQLNGTHGKFMLDTGDRSALSVCKDFAKATGLNSAYDHQPIRVTGEGIGGPIPARLAIINEIALGGPKLKNVMSRLTTLDSGFFAECPFMGSIGNEVLRRFNLTFDYRNQRLTLQKNRQFDELSCFTALPDARGDQARICSPDLKNSSSST